VATGDSGRDGIKDFGTGIGYTPINLVMAVRNWDRTSDRMAQRATQQGRTGYRL
jgi:hypothetical protein